MNGGSAIIVVPQEVIDELKLNSCTYKVAWVDVAILATKRCIVIFKIGGYEDMSWCKYHSNECHTHPTGEALGLALCSQGPQ